MTGTEITLRTLEDYAGTGRYNIVAPVVTVQGDGSPADSPYLVGAVSLVKINPNPAGTDVYSDFRFAKDGKVALTSLALTKLAQAAGVVWIPDECKILRRDRRPDGHVYIAYQAAAAIRSSSGEVFTEMASKEIDTEDIAEQLAEAYRRKLDSGRANFKEEEIPAMVRREVLQIREHALPLAETKAKSRCIRRILALPQVFTAAELQRPFAVPRLVIDPARLDPEQLMKMQLQGRRAATSLFGEERDAPEAGRSSSDTSVPAPLALADTGEERLLPGAGAPSPTDDGTAVGEQGGEGSGGDGEAPPGPEPLEDPRFRGGPYKGKSFSEVLEENPGYIEQVAKGVIAANDKVQELAGRWWARYEAGAA